MNNYLNKLLFFVSLTFFVQQSSANLDCKDLVENIQLAAKLHKSACMRSQLFATSAYFAASLGITLSFLNYSYRNDLSTFDENGKRVVPFREWLLMEKKRIGSAISIPALIALVCLVKTLWLNKRLTKS